jgi:hypothetical protein
MLCLQHGFYNILFKIKQSIYNVCVRPPPPPPKGKILGAHLPAKYDAAFLIAGQIPTAVVLRTRHEDTVAACSAGRRVQMLLGCGFKKAPQYRRTVGPDICLGRSLCVWLSDTEVIERRRGICAEMLEREELWVSL